MADRSHKADWLDRAPMDVDLRKRVSRSHAETIQERAAWLGEADEVLLLAVYRDGQSAAEIARLRGEDVRRTRRRIRNAVTRVFDPRLAFVVSRANAWSRSRRRVARSLFQHGRSIRQAAHELGLTIHQVRRHRDAVLDEMRAMGPRVQDAPDRAWRG